MVLGAGTVRGARRQDGGGRVGSSEGPERGLPFAAAAGGAYTIWARVKYLSGCSREAGGRAERAEQGMGRKQVPACHQGGGHGPPGPAARCPSSLPAPLCRVSPLSLAPGEGDGVRAAEGTRGQSCHWQPAHPRRAGRRGPRALGRELVPAAAFRQVLGRMGESLGACWYGERVDWFHTGPTLPSSCPRRSCGRRHPGPGGRQGRGPGRRGAEWGQGLPKGEAIPGQTHGPAPLGGAEGGRTSPSSRPTPGSCRGERNSTGPKHLLRPHSDIPASCISSSKQKITPVWPAGRGRFSCPSTLPW